MNWLISIALSVFATFIAAEIIGRAPKISAWLLRKAVMRLPRQHRERYHEEWTGDLLEQPTALSQVFYALGLAIAAQRILGSERRRVAQARYKLADRKGVMLLLFLIRLGRLQQRDLERLEAREGTFFLMLAMSMKVMLFYTAGFIVVARRYVDYARRR